MGTNIIKVVNIKCGGCEKGITDALEAKGLKNIRVDHESQTVKFEGEKSVGIQELTRLGYPEASSSNAKSTLKNAKSYQTCAVGTIKEGIEHKDKRKKKFWMLIGLIFLIVIFIGGVIFIIK